METELYCKDCNFFQHHYTKMSTHLMDVKCCGHCSHRCASYKKTSSRAHFDVACKYFEPAENLSEERKATSIDQLKYISKRLEEIALILKDDFSQNGK